jgi:hypothetical protein
VLSDVDDAFFMGDLNLESKNENAFLPSDYQDVWNILNNSNEPGYTYPAMTSQAVIRYDRILYRSNNS